MKILRILLLLSPPQEKNKMTSPFGNWDRQDIAYYYVTFLLDINLSANINMYTKHYH